MKPFPFQFTNYLDPGWRPPDSIEDPARAFRAATEKLRSHWARIGFKRVNGTDYCALSPARKRPSPRTIAAAIRQTGGPGGQQGSLLSGFPVEPEACSKRLWRKGRVYLTNRHGFKSLPPIQILSRKPT
jgi:hypothetical protein